MMRVTPINMAEAVFEPFWTPDLSGLTAWTIEPVGQQPHVVPRDQLRSGQSWGYETDTPHGLRVFQNWCFAAFEWARAPEAGPALRMRRSMDLDISGYDRLLMSATIPEGAVVRIIATTELGTRTLTAPPAGPLKHEYALELGGATRLHALQIEVDAADANVAYGWLNWLGLQNTRLLTRYLHQWRRFDAAWDGYLKPEDHTPRFEPSYGLLVNATELEALRTRHDAYVAQHGTSPFIQQAAGDQALVPEEMIGEYVNFWDDTRFCRDREYGRMLIRRGIEAKAAVAGLLLRDPDLLRLSARYGLSISMCEHWDDGMICFFPGAAWEHRPFIQSLCVHETALILDLAGELFTDHARQYILRRIADDGLGNINFNTWKHDYIFHNNQLAWFTPGRMLGYLVLERTMPRVTPYTEIAYDELMRSLDAIILPDGGYVEGPTYASWVVRCAGVALHYYARARGKTLAEVLPESMQRMAAFGAALASTDPTTDVIPICDGGSAFEQEALAVLASALPDSQWVTLFHASVRRTGMPASILACVLEQQIPADDPPPPTWTALPVMGLVASERRLGDHTVKLLILGNQAGADHTHEDKGSFVLEFAGEVFAMDPGTCDYSSPLAEIYKQCERHNMLVPSGTTERPAPLRPIHHDITPHGNGDEQRVHVAMDVSAGWEQYYAHWRRTWDAPDPATLTIHDDYALVRGDAVEFYWNTRLPVTIADDHLRITGERGSVTLDIPADCAVRVDTLPMFNGPPQHRIAFRKEGSSGTLSITAHLKETTP